MMIRFMIYFIIFFVSLGKITAQDNEKAKAWIAKSAAAFNELNSYAVDVEYRVYGGHNSPTALDVVKGSLKKSGTQTISDYRDAFLLEGSSQALVIDKVHKMIILRPEMKMPMRPVFSNVLDSISNYVDSLSYKEDISYVEITMWFPKDKGSLYEKLVMQIHKSNAQLSFLSLYYGYPVPMYEEESANQPGRLEIVYKNFRENPSLSSSEFSISSYVQKKDSGDWIGVNDYKNYQVVQIP